MGVLQSKLIYSHFHEPFCSRKTWVMRALDFSGPQKTLCEPKGYSEKAKGFIWLEKLFKRRAKLESIKLLNLIYSVFLRIFWGLFSFLVNRVAFSKKIDMRNLSLHELLRSFAFYSSNFIGYYFSFQLWRRKSFWTLFG